MSSRSGSRSKSSNPSPPMCRRRSRRRANKLSAPSSTATGRSASGGPRSASSSRRTPRPCACASIPWGLLGPRPPEEPRSGTASGLGRAPQLHPKRARLRLPRSQTRRARAPPRVEDHVGVRVSDSQGGNAAGALRRRRFRGLAAHGEDDSELRNVHLVTPTLAHIATAAVRDAPSRSGAASAPAAAAGRSRATSAPPSGV